MKAICRNQQQLERFVISVGQKYGMQYKKPLEVTCEEKKSTRSLEANAYLYGVCYETILEEGGLKEQGWRKEDLHEYFLGEHFGWQSLAAFGRKRLRPVHRSSNLSKPEFSDFILFIQQKAAEMGVVIPDPEG